MIIDGRKIPHESAIHADVCVVGSGPAGMAVALRLAKDPHIQVCLLESGGIGFDESVQELSKGDAVGTPYFPLESTRIRAFGGTTMSWGGICVQLDRSAFELRPWVADVAWPFLSDALEVYLEDALSFCGITEDARQKADSAFRARTEDRTLESSVLVPTNVYFGRPPRFGDTYRTEFADSRNVTVYLHSSVVRVETNENGSKTVSMLVRRHDGSEFRVLADYYVLGAGGIENARLLMASFRADRDRMNQGFGLVGQFFMEHPRYANRFRIRSGTTPLSQLIGRPPRASIHFARLALAPSVQRAEQVTGYHANLILGYLGDGTREWNAKRRLASLVRKPWCETPYSYPEGELKRLRGDDVSRLLMHPGRALSVAFSSYFRPSHLKRFLTIVSTVEQPPDRNNRLELVRDTDRLGLPKVRVHWQVGAEVQRTYAFGLRSVLAVLNTIEPGIAETEVEVGEPWPKGVFGTWHHMGTTRMHRDPTNGVVDDNCRLHALDNLYVAGSSVFPTSGTAAPTLTVVQLAMRLADHIKVRLGPKVTAKIEKIGRPVASRRLATPRVMRDLETSQRTSKSSQKEDQSKSRSD